MIAARPGRLLLSRALTCRPGGPGVSNVLAVVGVMGAVSLAASASGQVNLGGVSFANRAASGQINIGDVRGSLGVIDYDQDGWYDLFVADSSGRPNRLFHNVPDASTAGGRNFVDVSVASGIGDADGAARNYGSVVVFDFNNDGWPDIYHIGNGPDGSSGVLYRNNGDATFTNVSVVSGLRLSGLTQDCASAADFDHDGDVDLLLANISSTGRAVVLMENNGNGTFTSRPDLLPGVPYNGRIYAQGWTDYDHDGWEDCLVLLNAGRPLTLKNVPNPAGGRRLVDATTASGFTHVGPAPMGIAFGDMDGDGDLDISITDAVRGTYYENRDGTLVEVFPFATFFGWGTAWIDAENDGDLDNFQAGSWGGSNIDFLWRNDDDGAWTDARQALNIIARSTQHSAKVDFDNDGREDLLTVNPLVHVAFYHNQSTAGNHWIKIRLDGGVGTTPVSRDAVGARVRVVSGGKTQVRELAIGTSFGASEDPRLHFGVGSATRIDRIEVVWPRAGTLPERTQLLTGPIGVDQIVTIRPATCGPVDIAPLGGGVGPDGQVTVDDLTAYLAAFFQMEVARADIATLGGGACADGQLTVDDLVRYLALFFAGCQ